jgi:Arc/MetJ family transcription regulator
MEECMTPEEIQYLESRGWVREGAFYWRRSGGLNVMYWRMAMSQQLAADEPDLIAAFLEAPKLRAQVDALRGRLLSVAELIRQFQRSGKYACVDAMLTALLAELMIPDPTSTEVMP